MPQVITLIDNKVETIFDIRDFEDLVDKYRGYDARKYLEEVMDSVVAQEDYEEVEEKVEELTEKLEDLQGDYRGLEEEYETYKQEHGE
jgi:predicted nuclease with TOPRIM domain